MKSDCWECQGDDCEHYPTCGVNGCPIDDDVYLHDDNIYSGSKCSECDHFPYCSIGTSPFGLKYVTSQCEVDLSKSITYIANRFIEKGIPEHDARVKAIHDKLWNGTVLVYPNTPPYSSKWAITSEQLKRLMIKWQIHPDEIPILKSNFPHFLRLYRKEIEEKINVELLDPDEVEEIKSTIPSLGGICLIEEIKEVM